MPRDILRIIILSLSLISLNQEILYLNDFIKLYININRKNTNAE